MATKKRAEKLREDAKKAIEKTRTGVILTGRVVNGKVELDESCLRQIAKKFPGAEKSFIAVNAPFDPTTQLV